MITTLLVATILICFSNRVYSQSIIVEYSYGIGASDPSFNNDGDVSSCPISIVVNIPENASISGVDIDYRITATGSGTKEQQRSQLKCTSPGGTKEASVYQGSGSGTGTYNYHRQGINIANNVTCGGNIVFELHAGNTSDDSGCNTSSNFVENYWTIRVYYQLTPNCNAAPFGGVAVSSFYRGCEGIISEIELSASGYSSNMNGLSYMWQESSNGSDWSNITSSNNPDSEIYTATNSRYFRLAVGCSFSGQTGYSNLVHFIVEHCNEYRIGLETEAVYTDNALFYDSGGNSNHYLNNEQSNITFCSNSGEHIRVDFLSFNTEDNGEAGRNQVRFDKLNVWDGSNTNSHPMFEFSGLESGYNIVPLVISSGTCVSFSFSADDNTTKPGWKAHVTSTNEIPYVASQYCSTAPQICDLNGYIGSTSNFYNLERVNGQIQAESPLFPGYSELDNNSFIKFTASNSTVVLGINVSNCTEGFYDDPALQFAVYSGYNCNYFELVSSPSYIYPGLVEGYHEITLTNLSVGQTYYLMTDGGFGAICQYSISANSGIDIASVSPGNSTICEGEAATFTASGGTDYYWTGPNGFTSTQQSITVSEEGIYHISVSGGIDQCPTNTVMNTSLEVIGDFLTPIFDILDDYCKGDNIPNLPNTSFNGIDGIWNPAINNQRTTTYYFTAVSEPCTTPISVTLNISPDYFITPNEPNCFGDYGTIDVIENGLNTPYSYLFNGVNTSPPFSALAGNHQIIIRDIENCSDTISYTFNQPEILNIDYLLTNKSCYGQIDADITLNASGGTSPYSYFLQHESTILEAQTHTNLDQNNYIMIVSDSKDCITKTDLLLVEPAQLLADYSVQNPSCFGNDDGFVELFIEGGTEPYFIIFEQDTFNTPIISDLTDGLYDFSVLDTNQCTYEIRQISLTNPDIECLSIPNAFTPNNDGINDQWIIANLDLYKNAVVQIFNRWGQEIHRGDCNDKWDGYFNDKIVPTGTYLYILVLNDGTKPYVGTLEVVH